MRAIRVSALLSGALLFSSNLATFSQTASQTTARTTSQTTPQTVTQTDTPKQSETPKAAYDFSLSREEKIKLAESAAPAEVSGKAAVYVLDATGYVKVRDGENGFTCFVDRQSPLNLEPTCFDAEGSATTFPSRLLAEEMRAKGKSEEEVAAAIAEGYKTGKFRAPQKPGIVYMMSDAGFLYVAALNKMVRLPAHLMFYAPYATEKDIGSPPAAANMPRLIRAGQPDAVMIVIPAAAKAAK